MRCGSGNRWIAIAVVVISASLSSSAAEGTTDLPVATYGFEEWAGVTAKAMSFGGRNQEQSLEALKGFQSKVTAKLQEQASAVEKLQKGDLTDLITKILTPNINIQAPVFFQNNGGPQSAITQTIAAIQFTFTGVGYAPCAVPITPTGVGIFPQGINIQPAGLYIQPTGAQVQPQGLQIAPNLIVIGPYDTQVEPQGLNIAPALISIVPVKTLVNPVGPLSITDSLVSAEVPTPGR
ncbi:hypothetical protein WJX75_003560 [Coccomyxa subellipsoidea]|uniref:Uncharacterized protein n=1 Tax=Coccomyxa subellipsoidea TaxID=248742 RepID=A0ABR2Z127_9CHLO